MKEKIIEILNNLSEESYRGSEDIVIHKRDFERVAKEIEALIKVYLRY